MGFFEEATGVLARGTTFQTFNLGLLEQSWITPGFDRYHWWFSQDFWKGRGNSFCTRIQRIATGPIQVLTGLSTTNFIKSL